MSKNNTDPILEDCPFCGGPAIFKFAAPFYMLKKYHNRYIIAGCPKCKISTSLYFANNHTGSPLFNEANILEAKKKAAKDWNTRVK